MATITINTPAEVDTALARVLARHNQLRADEGKPPLTAAGFIEQVLLASIAQTVRHETAESIREAWANTTPAKREEVRQILGVN